MIQLYLDELLLFIKNNVRSDSRIAVDLANNVCRTHSRWQEFDGLEEVTWVKYLDKQVFYRRGGEFHSKEFIILGQCLERHKGQIIPVQGRAPSAAGGWPYAYCQE